MTEIRKMETLNLELIQEVDEYAESEECSTKDAFTKVFIDHIHVIDSGEFSLQDVEIKSYRNEEEKMRVNGYALNVFNTSEETKESFKSVTIVVSDYSSSSEIEYMGKTEAENLLKMAANFYAKAKSGYFKESIDYSNGVEIADALFTDNVEPERVYVVLLTNKIVKRFELKSYSKNKQEFQSVIWDLEKIYENNPTSEIVIDFEKYGLNGLSLIQVPEKSDEYDCFVGVIPGETLARIYENEDYRLFEKNIRVYLKCTGKINQGIRDTIKNNPHLFVAYNNGISTIADSVEVDPSSSGERIIVKKINGWQIVNGAQTTSTIYHVYKNSDAANILDDIFVQMKLVVLKNGVEADRKKELISNIALYANSQNPIKKSDFSAMDEYPQAMYKLSIETGLIDQSGKNYYPWFYENARGGYDAYKESRCRTASDIKKFEKTTKKITKTVAAKAQMLWIDDTKAPHIGPHIAAKGVETSYNEFIDLIKNNVVNSTPTKEDYIKLISQYIIYTTTDKIIKAESFGDWKSQQVCYTIALLRQYNSDLVDFEKIWKDQAIDIFLAEKIKALSYVVWDYFMSLEGSINIGQWCKKAECWDDLKQYYEGKNKAAD